MFTGRRIGAVVALVAPAVLLVHHQPVAAATITVTTTVDEVSANGQTSLREAVNQAGDGDVVSIPTGTYELACPGPQDQTNASGDLDIVNKSITLRGPATGTATVRPATGCQERVIDIVDTGSPNAVTIERLTIRGGRPTGTATGAGVNAAFLTATLLTIRDSVVTDNRAGDAGAFDAPSGGGVFLEQSGSLVIERSTISNNSVGSGGNSGGGSIVGWRAGGGGVAVRGFGSATGTVTIVDSTISGNTGGVGSLGGGGGLWLETGTVTLTDVVVTDNVVPSDPTGRVSGDGGGVAVVARSSLVDLDVSITGGVFSGNTIGRPATAGAPGIGVRGGHGGGLFIGEILTDFDFTGSVVIDGTEFVGNSAGDGGTQQLGTGVGGSGGNLHVAAFTSQPVDPVSVVIDAVSVRDGSAGDNDGSTSAGGSGGGAHIETGSSAVGGTVTVVDSVFEGNSAGVGLSAGGGGGLAARSVTPGTPGSITVSNSVFRSNAAGDGTDGGSGGSGGNGGGARLVVDGAGGAGVRATVIGSTFDQNGAGDGGDGSSSSGGFGGRAGGLYLVADRSVVAGTTFTANTAGDGGGGLSNGGPGGDGGGLFVSGSTAAFEAVTVSGNRSGAGADGGDFGNSGGDGGGVALDISVSAEIIDSTVTANETGGGGDGPDSSGNGGFGGGLMADLASGDLEIVDATISGNRTGDGGSSTGAGGGGGGFGGGIAVLGAGAGVSIERVVVAGNTTGDGGSGDTVLSARGGFGGGLSMRDSGTSGSFSVSGSSIVDNRTGAGGSATGSDRPGTFGGDGGGLWVNLASGVPAANGAITIDATSITGNRTGNGGAGTGTGISPPGGFGAGALLVTGSGGSARTSIGNATIAGNVTGQRAGGGSRGDGGGLFLDAPHRTVELEHVTIAGNTARNGDNILTEATSVEVRATVITDPDPGDSNPGENCNVPAGSIASLGHNVESADTCDFDAATDIRNFAAPTLAPLADNGGLGLTRPPLVTISASVVIDRIPAGDCTRSVDQRGFSRPFGSGCDIGAIELRPSITAVDDVIEVSGTSTDIDFLVNDLASEATLDQVTITLPRQPDTGTLLVEGGQWRFVSPQASGAFTDFEYQVCLGSTGICDTATVTLVPAGVARFVSLQPARVFDTRSGTTAPGPKGTIPAGGTIDVQVTGVAGIPTSGVSAVALNVTAARIDDAGFVTAFPTGTTRPTTSNLNVPGPGATVPNMVIVPVGAGGKVSFYSFGATNLIGDVAGYFTESGISTSAGTPGATGGRLVPIAPTRVFDNRPDTNEPGPKGLLTAGQTIDVQIAGRAGVPSSGAAAVVMNLTWTRTPGRGFATAFPAGTTLPTASNLNATGPNQTVANLVIVPLGAGGKISLYTDVGGYLLGDVTGYVTDATASRSLDGLFVPIAPGRVFDTRPAEPAAGPKGFVPAAGTIVTEYAGVAGLPDSGVGAVVTNVTAVRAADRGFITVWPDGLAQPNASTLNLSAAGETRPNAAVLPLGTDGRLRLFSFPGSHLLADAFGWFLG